MEEARNRKSSRERQRERDGDKTENRGYLTCRQDIPSKKTLQQRYLFFFLGQFSKTKVINPPLKATCFY